MNREIKFEYGFESVNGIVKKNYHLHEIPFIKTKCDVWGNLPIKYVRQYTGMKDKNGKEIYDGDIVMLVEAKRNYTVEYLEYGFKLVHAHPKMNRMHWGSINRVNELYFTIEVVGNIYMNPELLNL